MVEYIEKYNNELCMLGSRLNKWDHSEIYSFIILFMMQWYINKNTKNMVEYTKSIDNELCMLGSNLNTWSYGDAMNFGWHGWWCRNELMWWMLKVEE